MCERAQQHKDTDRKTDTHTRGSHILCAKKKTEIFWSSARLLEKSVVLWLFVLHYASQG